MKGKMEPCKICGKTFDTGGTAKKYCSADCAKAAKRETQRLSRARKRGGHNPKCKACGVEFIPGMPGRVYCDDCRMAKGMKPLRIRESNKDRKGSQLHELLLESREKGISYGKLMGMKILEQERKEREGKA